MKVKVLGSSSSGNCYILKSSNGKFCILDCGIDYKKITNDKDFSGFSDLDFVYSGHIHKDHNLSLKDFELAGCECVTYENIIPNKKIEIGDWTLYPFLVKHNVANYGIIIYNKYDNQKLVYATDFTQMPKIENVDYWLYEINYDEFTVNKLIENVDLAKLHIANNIDYHNSLQNAVEYFKSLQNRPKLIIACHLSEMGGSEKIISETMKPLCDRFEIATKNKIIEF